MKLTVCPVPHSAFTPAAMIAILCFASGCGSISPIWKGSCRDLAETKTLYYQQPCEYQINAENFSLSGPYALELTLTYYSQIGRSELPLYLSFEDDQHDIQDFHCSIPLKKDGRDLGMPAQNEIDLTLSYLALPFVELGAKSYTLRIFYDGEKLMEEEVEGIIDLEARLYQAEAFPKS